MREQIEVKKGLIIKQPWIDKILSREKTWEIRGSNTSTRGWIALIQSGTGLIVGTAELTRTRQLAQLDMHYYFDKHHVTDEVTYPKIWAWELNNAQRLPEPIPYNHPQGAVIWVNLEEVLT